MARYKATENGLIELTAEEIAWKDAKLAEQPSIDARKARQERDSKLRATDWRASSDLTLSTEWATYRQALRDIPSQAGFPNTITWPDEPGE